MSEGTTYNTTAWWSKAILIGGVVAAALLPVGALGSRFGIWPFTTGFLLLAAGVVLAAVGLVSGIVGIIATYRRDRPADRPSVYLGALLCLLILGLMGLQFYTASSVPPIHNISTNLLDPPQFDRIVELRGDNSNPLAFDADAIGPLQKAAYPWVDSLETDVLPPQALDRSRQILDDMGLSIVNVDPAAGRVEATDTTFWFGFKDDVVVRVRPAPGGSMVDLRSVSRVGQSDLGKNARRIGEFLDAFRG